MLPGEDSGAAKARPRLRKMAMVAAANFMFAVVWGSVWFVEGCSGS